MQRHQQIHRPSFKHGSDQYHYKRFDEEQERHRRHRFERPRTYTVIDRDREDRPHHNHHIDNNRRKNDHQEDRTSFHHNQFEWSSSSKNHHFNGKRKTYSYRRRASHLVDVFRPNYEEGNENHHFRKDKYHFVKKPGNYFPVHRERKNFSPCKDRFNKNRNLVEESNDKTSNDLKNPNNNVDGKIDDKVDGKIDNNVDGKIDNNVDGKIDTNVVGKVDNNETAIDIERALEMLINSNEITEKDIDKGKSYLDFPLSDDLTIVDMDLDSSSSFPEKNLKPCMTQTELLNELNEDLDMYEPVKPEVPKPSKVHKRRSTHYELEVDHKKIRTSIDDEKNKKTSTSDLKRRRMSIDIYKSRRKSVDVGKNEINPSETVGSKTGQSLNFPNLSKDYKIPKLKNKYSKETHVSTLGISDFFDETTVPDIKKFKPTPLKDSSHKKIIGDTSTSNAESTKIDRSKDLNKTDSIRNTENIKIDRSKDLNKTDSIRNTESIKIDRSRDLNKTDSIRNTESIKIDRSKDLNKTEAVKVINTNKTESVSSKESYKSKKNTHMQPDSSKNHPKKNLSSSIEHKFKKLFNSVPKENTRKVEHHKNTMKPKSIEKSPASKSKDASTQISERKLNQNVVLPIVKLRVMPNQELQKYTLTTTQAAPVKSKSPDKESISSSPRLASPSGKPITPRSTLKEFDFPSQTLPSTSRKSVSPPLNIKSPPGKSSSIHNKSLPNESSSQRHKSTPLSVPSESTSPHKSHESTPPPQKSVSQSPDRNYYYFSYKSPSSQITASTPPPKSTSSTLPKSMLPSIAESTPPFLSTNPTPPSLSPDPTPLCISPEHTPLSLSSEHTPLSLSSEHKPLSLSSEHTPLSLSSEQTPLCLSAVPTSPCLSPKSPPLIIEFETMSSSFEDYEDIPSPEVKKESEHIIREIQIETALKSEVEEFYNCRHLTIHQAVFQKCHKIVLVENECLEEATVMENPDVREEVEVIQQKTVKVNRNVREGVENIEQEPVEVIDLTAEVDSKESLLKLLEENTESSDKITLYRSNEDSDKTDCDDVQATSAVLPSSIILGPKETNDLDNKMCSDVKMESAKISDDKTPIEKEVTENKEEEMRTPKLQLINTKQNYLRINRSLFPDSVPVQTEANQPIVQNNVAQNAVVNLQNNIELSPFNFYTYRNFSHYVPFPLTDPWQKCMADYVMLAMQTKFWVKAHVSNLKAAYKSNLCSNAYHVELFAINSIENFKWKIYSENLMILLSKVHIDDIVALHPQTAIGLVYQYVKAYGIDSLPQFYLCLDSIMSKTKEFYLNHPNLKPFYLMVNECSNQIIRKANLATKSASEPTLNQQQLNILNKQIDFCNKITKFYQNKAAELRYQPTQTVAQQNISYPRTAFNFAQAQQGAARPTQGSSTSNEAIFKVPSPKDPHPQVAASTEYSFVSQTPRAQAHQRAVNGPSSNMVVIPQRSPSDSIQRLISIVQSPLTYENTRQQRPSSSNGSTANLLSRGSLVCNAPPMQQVQNVGAYETSSQQRSIVTQVPNNRPPVQQLAAKQPSYEATLLAQRFSKVRAQTLPNSTAQLTINSTIVQQPSPNNAQLTINSTTVQPPSPNNAQLSINSTTIQQPSPNNNEVTKTIPANKSSTVNSPQLISLLTNPPKEGNIEKREESQNEITNDSAEGSVIEIDWLDDFDSVKLKEEVDFIKKEEIIDEDDVVMNEEQFPFVCPSPADSGIEHSPSRQVEHTELVYCGRLCICDKPAVYICECRMVMYCSTSCQKQDWLQHKLICMKALSK